MSISKKRLSLLAVICICCVFVAQGFGKEVLYAPFADCSKDPLTVVYTGTMLKPVVCPFYNGQHPVGGKVGKGASFNGKQYVKVPNNPMLNFGVSDFAITFWVKTTCKKSNNTVIDKRAGSNSIGYHVTLYQGKPLLRMHTSAGYNYWGGPAINDGKWHYVAIYVDRDKPGGGKIYIDGSCVHTFNPTYHNSKSLDNRQPVWIGKHSDIKRNYFEGVLDEVRFFKSKPRPGVQLIKRGLKR